MEYIGTNDPKAVKIFSVQLFKQVLREGSKFIKMMSDAGQSTEKMVRSDLEKHQTSTHMPIVLVTDLRQKRGDRVTVDLMNRLSGLPIMGSDMAEGQGETLSWDTDEFKIDQTRKPVKSGDKMSQQRTVHNLRRLARSSLVDWFGRFFDQRIQVHLAGARGDDESDDWIIPKDTHPLFNRLMTNDVTPPTSGRYFIAGGQGNTVASIDNTDALKLEDFDMISAQLRESSNTIEGIQIHKDQYSMDERPMWCCFVSERQWHYLLMRTGEGSRSWRTFVAEAAKRMAITKHPLFMGDAGVWNGMLIKVCSRPIRFNEGSTVNVTNSKTGAVEGAKVPDDITVDRAIIVGAQALAMVMGDASGTGQMIGGKFPLFWSERMYDHNDKLEVLAGTMDGCGKVRFRRPNNSIEDYGVAVIDSYAPAVDSDKGHALRMALD